ncbi:DoxX family protein [Hymenobacter sp. DG25B]|uniref:DoxX family protein n=1 Tax=Hymenobacter sp. DG25B TaxID=1385664 RepID=UPI0005C93B7A|nr:DoxX family protein [Hymenobacter sp. DG25B]
MNYSAIAFALLRIVAGLLFAMHGSQKLLGFPGDGQTVPLGSLMGVAGIIELVGGTLVMLGLFTRVAAFIASGEMAVAYFMAHFPKHPLPLLNQGEPAVLFCFIFLFIAAFGAGIWSLDSLRHHRQPDVLPPTGSR